MAEGTETTSEVPEKFRSLVTTIEGLSVLELSELVKVLEKKFGVSAAAPIAVPGTQGAPGGAGTPGAAVEEQTEFSVELTAVGANKINVIKTVREITGKGLKEAKDLVEGAPKVLKENVAKAEAAEIEKKLVAAGAQVTVK